MDTLYWITRLDCVNTLIIVLFTIAACVFIGAVVGYFIAIDEDDINKVKPFIKKSLIAMGVMVPLWIFTPTTKQALVIYGVGSIIEYAAQSDKVKQLPDKAVEALSAYLDSINEEKEEETNENK